jgi:hypothetical protein
LEIDSEIARRVRAAQRRVRICSLLINSGTLIGELGNLLRSWRVAVDGIYDHTQMEQVYLQWQEVPQNRWKIEVNSWSRRIPTARRPRSLFPGSVR